MFNLPMLAFRWMVARFIASRPLAALMEAGTLTLMAMFFVLKVRVVGALVVAVEGTTRSGVVVWW